MYHPVLGTFLSRDPMPLEGQPVLLGQSLYAYIGNNPMNATDPFGLQEAKPDFPDATGGNQVWTCPGRTDRVKSFTLHDTYTKDCSECVRDATVQVYAYRCFRTYLGDNTPTNFFVDIQFRIKGKLVCDGRLVTDFDYYTYCRMPTGVFIRPTLNIFADAFDFDDQNTSPDTFVKKFCAGAQKLPVGHPSDKKTE